MNDNTEQVQVGDIFSMSWGYDQTNVNYFQVTRISKGGIFVREIGQESVPGTDGFMSCKVRPKKDAFLSTSQWCNPRGRSFCGNAETFRRLKNGRFNFKGRYFAHKVSTDSQTYCSWYA